MKTVTIQRKFPAKTVILAVALTVCIFIILGLTVPGLGSWMINGALAVLAAIAGFFLSALPQVLVTVGICIAIVAVWSYRKKYGKKKVLVSSTTQTPTYDTLSNPGLFEDDVEVSS